VLKETDAPILYPAMKKSASRLSGFISWAKYVPSWDISVVQKFVLDHVNSDFPRFHLIFTIGYEVVGFGSLAPMPDKRSVQVALWTSEGFEGQVLGLSPFLNGMPLMSLALIIATTNMPLEMNEAEDWQQEMASSSRMSFRRRELRGRK
jgi:hypothetical protein